MANIRLSIIIPHYNRPQLLAKLLDSIPDYPEIEVIVVDDKSNKDIEVYNEIISSFQNRNIYFFSNESKYKGAGAARNIAISHVNGDWIMFADADDYFLDGWYKNVKKYYSSNYDSIYYFATSIKLDDGSPATRHLNIGKKQLTYLNNPDSKNKNIIVYKNNSPCFRLIRANIIKQHSIQFEHIHRSEDVMFCTELAIHLHNITVDKSTIYCITDSKDSLSRGISEKDLLTDCQVYCRRYKYLQMKLSKQELKQLNISGIKYIIKALKQKRIVLSITILHMLITNRVRILPHIC